MERLTYRGTQTMTEDGMTTPSYSDYSTRRIIEKLAAYEDAEEQGLLLRLPCMVGDTLYYVDDIRKFVDECKVTKLEFRTMNKCHMRISIEMQGKLWHCIRDELIGEVAFFDKEEAEQALKRMEGE